MEIKRLEKSRIKEGLDLVWKVFCEFEAPEYSQDGIDEFKSFLDDKDKISQLSVYGAFEKQEIVGVIAMRKNHISLFFVKKEKHRQGIGQSLLKYALKDMDDKIYNGTVTVNASPYAVHIYKKLNFESVDVEQVVNGIRFTPMVYKGEV